MLNNDEKIISSFTGKLEEILTLELNAGNLICETYKGDWPYAGCIMLFLEKPFLTPIQRSIEGVVFRNVNDPHYWKAEYYDKTMNQFLCCGFGGVPDFSNM